MRDEDCFSKCKTAYEVNYIFSKPNDAKQYTEVLFEDRKADIQQLPNEIVAMLSEKLKMEEK